MKHLYFVFTLAFAYVVTDAETRCPRIGITASANTFRPSNSDIQLDPIYTEVSGKNKFGSETSTSTEDTYFDNQWDIGFHVGLGCLILKRLQIECLYDLGMMNLIVDSESKNRRFQIWLATPLQLKR